MLSLSLRLIPPMPHAHAHEHIRACLASAYLQAVRHNASDAETVRDLSEALTNTFGITYPQAKEATGILLHEEEYCKKFDCHRYDYI